MNSSGVIPPSLRYRPIANPELRAGIWSQVCAMQYETAAIGGFPVHRLAGARFGAVDLVRYEGRGSEHAVRTLKHVKIDAADNFVLSMPTGANLHIEHAGNRSVIGPGTAVLVTASKPFDIAVEALNGHNEFSTTQIRIPGPLLRQRLAAIDRWCNREINLSCAAGRILQAAVQSTLQDGQSLLEAQVERQGLVLIELVTNLAQCLVGQAPTNVSNAHEALFARACHFIESRLSNSSLDGAMIADHCGVSLRYLHKVFASHSVSLAGVVRELRLLGCRRALCDGGLRHRSIIEIAYGWGFTDPSHFGRIYRKRFGVSPSQDRIVHH